MEITLIDKMGTDLSVVNAARVSYAKTKDAFDVVKDEKLIKYLADTSTGHRSHMHHYSLGLKHPYSLQGNWSNTKWALCGTRYQDAMWTMHQSCTNQTHGGADHRIQNRVQTEK